MKLHFESSSNLSLGAELELQLLDKDTLALSSSAAAVLKRLAGFRPVQGELYQSMIEIATGICADAHVAGAELRAALVRLSAACGDLGLELAGAGTHPTGTHCENVISGGRRYQELVNNHQWLTRRLLIFGLHVHVGTRDGATAIEMFNRLMPYLPLVLALSSSSPFCGGDDTRLRSSRTTFFESLPTGGHPCRFESWEDFQLTYLGLLKSGSVTCAKDLWWDIRPRPDFGTLEIRICDSPPTVAEAEALIALIHVLCQKIQSDIAHRRPPPEYPSWILRENKRRAMLKGTAAEVIISTAGTTQGLGEYLSDALDTVAAEIKANGYEKQMSLLRKIAANGSSADRQRSVYEASGGDFHKVLRSLTQELNADRPIWTPTEGGERCA